jgi:hypothetical protein
MDHAAATEQFVTAHAAHVARQSPPLQGTASAALAIDRVKYTHDAMIDLIISTPGVSQGTLAKHFGYTAPWVSRILNSDAFQARLAQRKSDVIDPSLVLSIDERLRAVAAKSLDIVLEKLEATQSLDAALKAVDMSVKALGYGARAQNVAVQQNFVVALPPKSESALAWAKEHGALAGVSPDLVELVERIDQK